MESVTPEPVTPALLWALAAHLVFAATSIWLVVVDLREHRLPNRIVAWSTGGILALFIASSAINAASEAAQPWNKLLVSVLSGVGYGLVFFLLWFFAPRALGAGDVKLAPLIGLMAGWSGLWVAALWVPLFIGVIGGIAGLVGRTKRQEFFAFGPVLIGACWLAALLAGVGWIR